MNVILVKDVEHLGNASDVVKVKPGYGRNFLIPRGLALIANDKNRAILGERLRIEQEKEAQLLAQLRADLAKLDGVTIKIAAKAGTSGKIFGSVTAIQISQAIKDQVGIDIDRRKIELTEEVKNLGDYTATLSLHKEVQGSVNFSVEAD